MKGIYERFTKRTLLSILILHFSVLSFAVTYYIAPNGSDTAGDGTIIKPFFTLNKVWTVIGAGDTVYLRGGIYAFNSQQSLTGKNGTSGNQINIFAYPGETPILTKSGSYTETYGRGIYFVGNYFHWKGLEISGFVQLATTTQVVWGMRVDNSSYNTFENLNVHNNSCGLCIANSGTVLHCTGNLVLNCDFHENADPLTSGDQYGNADGLSIAWITHPEDTNTVRGCRFWWNSDDGIDMYNNDGYVLIEDCQSFYNGYLANTFTPAGDGIGFKFGDSSIDMRNDLKRTIKNCISIKNKRNGFGQNGLNGRVEMYNCTAYNGIESNSIGIHLADFNLSHIVKNCISYSNTNNTALGTGTTATNNSWQVATVTSSDFSSLDLTQLLAARQSDGSLPVTNFLKLASTSDLIDKGTPISGINYNGSAPDIGAYEAANADVDKPVVTVFSIPSTSTSLIVPISSLNVTDNIRVTGYLLTETPSTPALNANGWSVTKPTSYVFSTIGSKTLYAWVKDAAGNVSNSLQASVTISSPVATTFTFTGPTSGNVNSTSGNFTVKPNNSYTGTVTITPTGAGSTGLAAKVLTFSNSSTAQTFTIVPNVSGSIVLTPTNSGSLTNPSTRTYSVNAVVPGVPTSVAATAGNTTTSVTFVAPMNTGGTAITGYTVTSIPAGGIDSNAGSNLLTHTVTGLTNGISYTFTVKATNSVGSSLSSNPSNSVVPVENLIPKLAEILPTHFIPVWQGENGLNHMNIMVVSASMEDLPLAVDDEIAVFDGSICVGSMRLTESINPADNTSYLTIPASQNDGSNNGFNENDTILFKIWDNQNQKEMVAKVVTYRKEIPSWLTSGKYAAGSTSVVELVSYAEFAQSIELVKGYNLISTYVTVQNPDVSVVTQSLCEQGSLVKIQDESGNSLEDWGSFGGWINNVGNLETTEGYKIKVANDCILQITGRPIALPLDISLKTGWNIISFPRTDLVDALQIVQSLIDQNKLVKVQDELGNSIENWGIFGGWKNGIGNFIPGKAYKVKLSGDAILTIQENYTKSAVIAAKIEKTEYFSTGMIGNGSDHMNINLVGLKAIKLIAGDELAAFDGDICVGTLKITENNIFDGSASLVASFSSDDQIKDGFTVGNPIQIYAWNKMTGNEFQIQVVVVDGQLKYSKNSTVLLNLKSLTTAITNLNETVRIDVFPNPSQGRFTVRFSEIPDATGRIEILDVSGRIITSKSNLNTSEEFNLDNQPSGLYMVKTTLGSTQTIHKLIIN